MDTDDRPVGRVLSRRELLTTLGIAAASVAIGLPVGRRSLALASTLSQDCIVRPEQTEGPYFVDERLQRSDLRVDPATGERKAGTPLKLDLDVSRVTRDGCLPLSGARVDVWHCDADGVYSDVRDPSFDTSGHAFLRGYQLTDASGRARFRTIYPGWYEGRTVHIHFKVRTSPKQRRGYDFTSQLYFDDRLNDVVLARPPYSRRGTRAVRNRMDGIYRDGGDRLMLAPVKSGDGYAARFALALKLA